ncbi:glycosyltransferase family 2 protein [Shewanella violacea]|uniref:Glycosyl transferase, putative n=1 Tax=Shewanella violacea (strain JCM 10179 / CIP 106290 / LMG 19151 / DSS12) TaxID=637905 RepID=D4ZDE9_SHEVD|nr:glycosyltransferase family 2 protein [Shewanella violacea]BAJ00071.1 glycosyl transferase, putative [Shewanella violacea DSS12]
MTVSLIITTYNWPKALDRVLKSTLIQSIQPDEIIIADDGSSEATKHVIDKHRAKTNISIIHSWQEDKGFRLSRSRNNAISKSSMDYIILIDGDMVLERHFIADHIKHSERGFFAVGKRVRLSESMTSKQLSLPGEISPFSKGISRGREHSIRLPLLSKLFSKTQMNSVSSIQSCNIAFWKLDAISINGFNNDFVGWGPEDKEFSLRLLNNGILRKNIKFSAIAFHLYHKENSKGMLKVNTDILALCLAQKSNWCSNGLNEFSKTKPAL